MATLVMKKPQDLLASATATPTLVEVPAASYLMIDGKGDPATSSAFDAAWETLRPLVSALHRLITPHSERPLALESLWWTPEDAPSDPEGWTLMAVLPEEATLTHLERALVRLHAKEASLPAFGDLRFGRLDEVKAVQMLQRGPYRHEGRALDRLNHFVRAHGLCLTGPRHEIYLGDPRRSAHGKLKTIVRHPVSQT